MLKNCCLRVLFKTGSSDLAVVEESWAKPFCFLFCLEVVCGHYLSCRSWTASHVSTLLLALLLYQEEQLVNLQRCVRLLCCSFAWEWFGSLSLGCERGPGFCSSTCWWTLPWSVGYIDYTYISCQCQHSKQNCFGPANCEVSLTLEGATNKVILGYFLFCFLSASKTLSFNEDWNTPSKSKYSPLIIWFQSWKYEQCIVGYVDKTGNIGGRLWSSWILGLACL